MLQAVANASCLGDYVVNWQGVNTTTAYTLQEDRDAGFSAPAKLYDGPDTSFSVNGRRAGRYFYRVAARNNAGQGAWSTVQFTDVCWEKEPNNTYQTANGPLEAGITYYAYPNLDIDNLSKDYFSVFMATPGRLVVDVSNHSGGEPQVQLFYQNTGNQVGIDYDAPFHIDYSGPAGWYYVYVSSGPPFSSSAAYTVRVEMPR